MPKKVDSDSVSQKRLGAWLKASRHALRMTVEELSADSGVSAATISRLENGQVFDPSICSLVRLVDCMGLDYEDMVSHVDYDRSHVKRKAMHVERIRFKGGALSAEEISIIQGVVNTLRSRQ